MPRGGARPGAGRKPKPKSEPTPPKNPARVFTEADGRKGPDESTNFPFGTLPPEPEKPPLDLSGLTPLGYLLGIVRDEGADTKTRIQAAAIAAPYVHAKPSDAGKKAAKQQKAKEVAASGKFTASPPPLRVVGR